MAAVASVASTTYTLSGGVTVTKPTGLAVGDLMVAHCSQISNNATNFSTPAGWTSLGQDLVGDARQAVFYKFADSADVAASDFTFSTGQTLFKAAGIARVTDVSVSATIAATTTSVTNSGSGTLTMATQTPLRGDCLLMFAASGGVAATASNYVFSSPTIATSNPSWTTRWNLTDSDTNTAGTIYLASAERPEATATGSATLTYASGGASADAVGYFILINDSVALSLAPDSLVITSTVPYAVVDKPTIMAVVNDPTVLATNLPTQWQNETKPTTTWNNET